MHGESSPISAVSNGLVGKPLRLLLTKASSACLGCYEGLTTSDILLRMAEIRNASSGLRAKGSVVECKALKRSMIFISYVYWRSGQRLKSIWGLGIIAINVHVYPIADNTKNICHP